MRRVVGTILAFVAGLVGLYIVVVVIAHWLMQESPYLATNQSRRIAFELGPLCALVGALVSAPVAQRLLARREADTVSIAESPRRRKPTNAGGLLATLLDRPDPLKALWAVGAVICAAFIVIFIWDIQPNSLGYWRWDNAAIWAGFFFAPLISLLWAAVAGATTTYVWIRRAIQLHAVLAFVTTLSGCSGLLASPWQFYGLLAFGAIFVDLIVLGLSPWFPTNADDVRFYRKAQLLISGGTLAAIVVWSFLNVGIVVTQAHFTAAGRPYCLQVAGDYLGRYKQVRSLMELNGLKMHTPFTNAGGSSDFQFAFHAVLIVENEKAVDWANWSYQQQRFIPFTTRMRPTCKPAVNFVTGLSLW